MKNKRAGKKYQNKDPNHLKLKALQEYQRTMHQVCRWRFRDRFDVAMFLITGGVTIKSILLYPFNRIFSNNRTEG